MKIPEEYIKPIEDLFKQPGNRDSYSDYNEGWIDACCAFYDVISQVQRDANADIESRLEALERRSAEANETLDKILAEVDHRKFLEEKEERAFNFLLFGI